jgi:hypothetical protein
MPIIRDIPIAIDPDHLLRSEGDTDHELIVDTAAWAAKHSTTLADPRIVYSLLPELSRHENRLAIGESKLNIGPMIRLLEPAQTAVVGVVTIGSAIEEETLELQKKGLQLEGYMLGLAASAALESAALELKILTENLAKKRGWGVSPALSPGALTGWPASDQTQLCTLLSLKDIGVEISSSGLLDPKYSMSLMIGLGPGYTSKKVADTCGYCSLKKTCPYRIS